MRDPLPRRIRAGLRPKAAVSHRVRARLRLARPAAAIPQRIRAGLRSAGPAAAVPYRIRVALRAGLVAAVVSGAPSTAIALARGDDLLDGARAAGALLLPRERRTLPLLAAAVPVHLALSLGWAVVLERAVPRGREVAGCLAGGLAIAALDLGVIGRRLPRIRELPQARQWADHAAYGLVVGAVLARRRTQGPQRRP